MGYLSNVKKQYCISFFHSLIPAYVIERLFWQQRGMDIQMVVYTEIIYALTVTLLEVPSGIIADKFGRKRMLVADNVLAVAELLLLLFARSFWQFALAIFVAGVGRAFSSGSENALLYDSLLSGGKQDDFEKHLGRIAAIDFTGSMLAAISGGILANYFQLEFNYILSAGSMCAAFALSLSLREPPLLTKQGDEAVSVAKTIKSAAGIFRANPLVLIYSLTGAVLGSCMIYLDEFWQIVLENIGVSGVFFGAVSAASMLLRIPGNLLAYKLKEKFSYRQILTCITIAGIAGYAAIFLTRNLLCLAPMMVLFAVSGIADPLVAGFLHRHAESAVRATAESFSSLGLRAVSVGVGLIFGYASSSWSVFAGFLALSAVCSLYLAVFRFALKKV
jgi:MFS family permease